MSKELAQTVRSKKIAALVAILALVVMFSFAGQSETAYAQNADSDAVVTTSHDLAITGIDVTGVDNFRPPGLASSAVPTTTDLTQYSVTTAIDTDGVDTVRPPGPAALVAFPGTWATIESTRNSVYANTVVNHPPGFAPAAIPSAWTNTFLLNSVGMNATSADLMRDSRYVIAVVNGETLLGNPGTANDLAIAVNTHTGASADTPSSSAFGTVIDLVSSPVVGIALLAAVLATLFVLTVVIGYLVVTSMYDRSSRATTAATRRLTATNGFNRWLTARLATLVTMIRPITNAATRAGQAIKNAPRQLDVKRFDMRAERHLGYPFA